MSEPSVTVKGLSIGEDRVVFRSSRRAYLTTGAFAGFFIFAGALVTFEHRGAWPALAAALAGAGFLFVKLFVRRLEIGSLGVRYRELGTDRTLAFGSLSRAAFQVLVNRVAPQGVALFWLHPKNGVPLRVDLRGFSGAAMLQLFNCLQRYRIPIEGADTPAARRVMHEAMGEGGGNKR